MSLRKYVAAFVDSKTSLVHHTANSFLNHIHVQLRYEFQIPAALDEEYAYG